METAMADMVNRMEQSGRDRENNRVPLAAFAFVRIFLGVMWLYEALRGAPWEWVAAVAGILLLIGLFTPAASLLSAITTFIVYSRSSSPEAWGTWSWLYWDVVLMSLIVFFTAAGRVWGIDALLARRKTLWPIW
jgi:uncharacterized membrane protein YphA (DoxX/SURF4 family)